MVDPDDANRDWHAALALEVLNLILEVADDPPDLADHRLLHDLDLDPDLDRRDRAALYRVAFHRQRSHIRYDLTEAAIAAAREYADADVGDVEHGKPLGNAVEIFLRAAELVQVFQKLNRHPVA